MRQLFILTLLLLTRCGFHLRGTVQLPDTLSTMAVVDAVPATDIAPDLRRALKSQGIRVTDTALLHLVLRSESFFKRVLSVDSEGRAQEYGLSYAVRFGLRDEEGLVWLPEESITLSRDLRFDATAVLGTSSEEAQLKDEMRRDVVLRILRRLQHARKPVEQAELK